MRRRKNRGGGVEGIERGDGGGKGIMRRNRWVEGVRENDEGKNEGRRRRRRRGGKGEGGEDGVVLVWDSPYNSFNYLYFSRTMSIMDIM